MGSFRVLLVVVVASLATTSVADARGLLARWFAPKKQVEVANPTAELAALKTKLRQRQYQFVPMRGGLIAEKGDRLIAFSDGRVRRFSTSLAPTWRPAGFPPAPRAALRPKAALLTMANELLASHGSNLKASLGERLLQRAEGKALFDHPRLAKAKISTYVQSNGKGVTITLHQKRQAINYRFKLQREKGSKTRLVWQETEVAYYSTKRTGDVVEDALARLIPKRSVVYQPDQIVYRDGKQTIIERIVNEIAPTSEGLYQVVTARERRVSRDKWLKGESGESEHLRVTEVSRDGKPYDLVRSRTDQRTGKITIASSRDQRLTQIGGSKGNQSVLYVPPPRGGYEAQAERERLAWATRRSAKVTVDIDGFPLLSHIMANLSERLTGKRPLVKEHKMIKIEPASPPPTVITKPDLLTVIKLQDGPAQAGKKVVLPAWIEAFDRQFATLSHARP